MSTQGIIYAIYGLCFLCLPIMWVAFKMAPWAAPLAACSGFALFVMGAYAGSGQMMGFGAGLFFFCTLIFVTANPLD